MSEETKWAVEWKDGLGRSRWQPIFPNGQRLWWRERDLSAAVVLQDVRALLPAMREAGAR